MFKRQTTGSVVCASCGYLVGVNDDKCYHCGRRNPGLWGFAPALRQLGNDLGFVPFVIGACVIIYGLMLFAARTSTEFTLSPTDPALFLFGASGARPMFYDGRWWTVLSASWLHASPLHLLFNVLWIRQLAPAVAEFYGAGRMIIIYTVAGVAGFALSSAMWFAHIPVPFLQGSYLTAGASASIFGLLGALVYYGRRSGSRYVHAQAVSWALFAGVFGLILPHIDNFAHAGGFLGGYLIGRILDPLKPERINHLGLALVCLVLSMLAILVSIVEALPYVQYLQ